MKNLLADGCVQLSVFGILEYQKKISSIGVEWPDLDLIFPIREQSEKSSCPLVYAVSRLSQVSSVQVQDYSEDLAAILLKGLAGSYDLG